MIEIALKMLTGLQLHSASWFRACSLLQLDR